MHLKADIRREKIAQRLAMQDDAYKALSMQIMSQFIVYIKPDDKNIALYSPIRKEVDISALAAYENTCLPVISHHSKILLFRHIPKHYPLEKNKHGILQPPETAAIVQPDIIIVPVVAFDRKGFRIGYGGGYYDATLSELRSARKITAIGVAFAFQEVAAVPTEAFDQKLDVMITEQEIIEI